MSSPWDWFRESQLGFEAKGDRERLEMSKLHFEATDYGEKDPSAMVQTLMRGRDQARRLEEPWWAFTYEVWIAIAYEHYAGELEKALPQALHCVNESRKPLYKDHPWRLASFNTLLICYVRIDPISHTEAIESCLGELRQEIPPGLNDHRSVMLTHQCEFLLGTRRIDEAETVVLEHVDLLDNAHQGSNWFPMLASMQVCRVGWYRENWRMVQAFAEMAEKLSRDLNNTQKSVSEALALLAIVARKTGDKDQAARMFRAALNRLQDVEGTLTPEHYDVVAHYYEMDGDLEKILHVREVQVKALEGKGRVAFSAEAQLKRCQALKALGRLTSADVDLARQSLEKMKRPGWYQELFLSLSQ